KPLGELRVERAFPQIYRPRLRTEMAQTGAGYSRLASVHALGSRRRAQGTAAPGGVSRVEPMASRVLSPPRRRGATRPAVLVIEDDLPVADIMAEALRREGYDCLVTEVAEDALQMLMHMSFDLAVIDIF